MAPRNPCIKCAENLDTRSEKTLLEHMSPLPPPSPTGYEHCFLIHRNPDDDSEPSQFFIQTIYYLPTGPWTLPTDASIFSALTQSQRDVLHYILEDRNDRTSENGRWVLAGIQGVRATADEGRSEDFQITIMYCEYGIAVNRRINRSYPATTSDDNGDESSMRDSKLQESEEDREEEQITGAKMDKGKQIMGRENSNMDQGWNSSSPAPDKDVYLAFPENAKRWKTDSLRIQNEGHGIGDATATTNNAGQVITPSTTLRIPKIRPDENYDCGRAPNPGTFSLPNTHRISAETVGSATAPPSPATKQAAGSHWKPSSAISENRATPLLLLSSSERQQHSNGMDQTQKERFPTLTSSQLSDMHTFACELRREGYYQWAILLFRFVWYCRETLIGPFHYGTLNTLRQLAATYESSGQADMATSLQVVLALRSSPKSSTTELAGPARLPTVSEMFEAQRWAIELRRRRDFHRAISMLTVVWYVWDIFGGEWYGSTRAALDELAVTYAISNQSDKANILWDKLAGRRKRN